MVPAPVAGENLERRDRRGDHAEVQPPLFGHLSEVAVGLREFEAAVEEHHRSLGGDLLDEIEDYQRVLSAAERDVALVIVKVTPDPAP